MNYWGPRIALVLLGAVIGGPNAISDETGIPQVVVSIGPLHSLVSGIMGSHGEPDLILRGNSSPHACQLRPSQAAALAKAGLVVWVGSSLEGCLKGPIEQIASRARVIELAALSDLHLLPARPAGVWHETEHHHNDHKASDLRIDPHIWARPSNAIRLVQHIANELTALDPAHGRFYVSNSEVLIGRIKTLDHEIALKLDPVADVPFIVFHDSTQYFVDRYGLNALGAVTVSPDHPASAHRLGRLRSIVKDSRVRCVFTEPQFSPSIALTLIEKTGARLGVIDPLGSTIEPGPEAYLTTMNNLADAFVSCLSGH